MDAPNRGALMLVRFIAACGIGMSLVEIALMMVLFQYRGTPINFFYVALWLTLSLISVVVLIKAKAIAGWISEKLDL